MLKKRILVVDDDKEIVRLMSSYLEAAGYEVLAAYNGETALHTIRRERPDLVLLDLMLPERDGLEITRLLRSDPYAGADAGDHGHRPGQRYGQDRRAGDGRR